MKKPDHPMEKYEDALFELLLDRVAEQEGLALMAEAQRLNDDPSVQIPEGLDRKCLKMIRSAGRKRPAKNAKQFTLKTIQRVAVAVFALIVLMTVAYATIPKFRVGVLNLLITVTDTHTGLSFGEKEPAASNDPSPDSAHLYRYSLPKIPSGYCLIDCHENERSRTFIYSNTANERITIFFVSVSLSANYAVDTEAAQIVRDININGHTGLYVEKNGRTQIAWADVDHMIFIGVITDGLDKDETIQLAEQIKYTESSLHIKAPTVSDAPASDAPSVYQYSLPKIPDGYDLIHSLENEIARSFLYANASNEKLSFDVVRGNTSSNYAVDTENAQVVCDIYINGYKGIYIEKDGYIHIAWADTDRMVFLGVIAEGLDKDETIQLAEQMKYTDRSR